MSVDKTALVALTSPEGSENYFSRLVNLRDETTNELFFRIIDCLMICKECRKLEAAEQAKCTHVKQEAFWLDNRKINRLKQLYKADPATLLREFGGAIADDYEPCFDRHEISVFFNRAPVLAMSPPKQIYVSVDPNGGGASRMAITSGYFDPRGHFVVLGLDLENTKSAPQIRDMLNRHFDAINRSNPHFATIRKVFIPENNLGHEASYMQGMLLERPDSYNIVTYYQKSDRPGVYKGPETADYYVAAINDALRVGKVHFSHEFFTTSRKETVETIKVALQEEMQRFHVELRRAKTNFDKTRRVVTGKGGGGVQDDLFISFAQAYFHGKEAEFATESCFH